MNDIEIIIKLVQVNRFLIRLEIKKTDLNYLRNMQQQNKYMYNENVNLVLSFSCSYFQWDFISICKVLKIIVSLLFQQIKIADKISIKIGSTSSPLFLKLN